MTQRKLEDRVAALEKQVAELKAGLANGARPGDWRSTIGMFTGDEIMRQVFEEALKIREADRRKAHLRWGEGSRTSP
jgi:hypothetical protein